ncbi:MAG: hypothetical protein D8H99_25025 [Streptococcus sp.]|nr:MAG: hypothetical protein D8H99_25025 [Streptococcus sp.]
MINPTTIIGVTLFIITLIYIIKVIIPLYKIYHKYYVEQDLLDNYKYLKHKKIETENDIVKILTKLDSDVDTFYIINQPANLLLLTSLLNIITLLLQFYAQSIQLTELTWITSIITTPQTFIILALSYITFVTDTKRKKNSRKMLYHFVGILYFENYCLRYIRDHIQLYELGSELEKEFKENFATLDDEHKGIVDMMHELPELVQLKHKMDADMEELLPRKE